MLDGVAVLGGTCFVGLLSALRVPLYLTVVEGSFLSPGIMPPPPFFSSSLPFSVTGFAALLELLSAVFSLTMGLNKPS